ncbi:bifunctional proline dehydrogenase/L-glutamate gamma-semialdehyde dehydrogenase [Actinotalea sp. K2]|uniref:bifunctional proline dehydrogenase/L-glutamate gamma-semialdehyde dehydrogenase n=1 Tax=Actinotalea sp. K2 TaxID=2939438 RepID=UPI002017850E|nr:bifunctional proline dehydrogenase/L-glutamate gamma-semialdehyde dehydrogenase [Actinotalea sp. K2]MCL3862832.1 bifunctional proline dehydrogenase/L-glutamate gamma-semialdehyde dehydrogenase [Actinotalea sp. K2]
MHTQTLTQCARPAADLADRWMAATAAGETARERRTTGRLAALVSDPAGLELAVRFVDRVARPQDTAVAAHELTGLAASADAAAGFLGPVDRTLLRLGTLVAPVLPQVVVPAARARLRQLVGHLVADAGPGLGAHLAAARADGFGLNLNLLGEAVLGEAEARSRLDRVRALIERPDVDYVSIKVSAVASQLSTWDTAGSRDRVVERLRPLYLTAQHHGTFINLDMEEYRDLALTVQVFERLVTDPALHDLEMGIVLQAYLPDAHAAFDEIAAMAQRRVEQGGARLKVRLVKGANLAMERVEAEIHGWPQAPYPTKPDVDASYVRLLDTALRPASTSALRVGVASHNLFHVALAHLVAAERGVGADLDVEMLQGMAPAQARAVQADVGRVLLYTPVVAREDFDVAIAYLIRRLEENAAEQNFLHALFAGEPAHGGRRPSALDRQREAFLTSVREAGTVSTTPRRTERTGLPAEDPFTNAPDTDPAVEASRRWAQDLLTRDVLVPDGVPITSVADVDAAVDRAAELAAGWHDTPPGRRAEVLRLAARYLEELRGDLVATMVQEAGKTVAEADPEVSEAVDFARYYAEQAELLADGAVPGAVYRAHGLTVVAPPWNFPVAIPLGSTLAALAAGSPVLVKPAPPTPRCVQVAVGAVHRALDDMGLPRDVVQVVLSPEGEVGRRLVTHPAVSRVVLTGSIETAQLFASWRPDLDVLAETSGKNALIVTPSADVDLAVADAVRSAFGHAGQKCSAASLLILVGSAGRSDRLRRQLADAVTSLQVGPATELSTTVGPLTEPATGKLLRALTTLDPGEAWLVEPRRLDAEGRSWTPGVKHGVAPGSFFHLTECFGPVLGVMRTETLDEAIAWQNAVAFGLTGGIHSLDEAEVATWLERVEVGNAYVNRHITGAVVRRQPFGGWKASVVGPGAKAGGPNYLAELGTWTDSPDVPQQDDEWLAWAEADDQRWWDRELGGEHDPSGLHSEANVLRYRPVPHLTVRVTQDARDREVRRVLAAAALAGVPVTVSRASHEDDATFAARVRSGAVSGRVRVIGTAAGLRDAAAGRVGEVTVLDGPVLASGRRELLTVLREQAISRTLHRFGHVTEPRSKR